MTTIVGNTYPVKDQIKALGGKWNPVKKGWDVPDSSADKARALVASAPKSSGSFTGYRRASDGNYAPGGRRCKYCGSRSCQGAWGHLCDED